MQQPIELVERYVAMWNDPDPAVRSTTVRDLWATDGAQLLQPPEDMREEAARIGFINPVLEARGHDALEARVTRAHEEFVRPGQFRFRLHGDAARLANVIKFRWEMVPIAGGPVAAVGLEFLILDAHGRIQSDYQFIER
jgi:hypothetical protein